MESLLLTLLVSIELAPQNIVSKVTFAFYSAEISMFQSVPNSQTITRKAS